MRTRAILAFALLLGATARAVSGESLETVVLRHGGQTQLLSGAEDTLRKLGVELLESSNFNTAAHPDILKQSTPVIHDRYRRVVAGDCLIITYGHAVKRHTLGGDVLVFEIVIGLGQPDHADAVFTIDDQGRVVAHEKYSGSIAMELRKAAHLAANAR